MGTDAILDWFESVFKSFLNSMPTNSPWDSSQGASWSMWTTMDYFIPVHELLSVFAVVFALGGPLMIASLMVWLIIGVYQKSPVKV